MDKSSFNPDIGHFKIQERILNSIKNNRLPHALLFHGKEGTGKAAFAIEVAKLLNCEKGPLYVCQKCPQCIKIGKLEHPDLKFIFPAPSSAGTKPEEFAEALLTKAANPYQRVHFAGKNSFISIDAVRALKYDAKFKLYEGKKKVFIVEDADEMRPEAANALLKILEEPPLNLALVLTTSKLSRILPTIRSRSQLVYFPSLEGDEILRIIKKYSKDTPDHLARIIRLSMGNIKFAFDLIGEDIFQKRDQAIDFLRKTVIIEKTHELANQIAGFTASRDRRNMILILFFLLTWFHDALHYKINPRQTNSLINTDLEENLTGFVTGYPKANYHKLIETTQKAIEELEDARNLNPTLIFTNLSIKLNRMIKHR